MWLLPSQTERGKDVRLTAHAAKRLSRTNLRESMLIESKAARQGVGANSNIECVAAREVEDCEWELSRRGHKEI